MQLWSTDGPPRLVRSLAGLRSMFGQPEAVQSVAFSPDGRVLAASDDDKTGPVRGEATGSDFASVAVWQVGTGRLLVTPADLNASPGNGVQPVGDDLLAFSPNGGLLALSLFDRSILILDPTTGQVRQVLISAAGTTSLAFAPDGTLANGTPAGTVELWNPITGREIDPPLLVAAAPSPVSPSTGPGRGSRPPPRGRARSSCGSLPGSDSWALPSAPTRAPRRRWHSSPADDRLLGIDDDGHGFAWPISLAAWERQACTIASRSLARQEWTQLGIDARYATVCP